MCSFRFKLWWMIQQMGTCGKEVPPETQFLLLESKHKSPRSGNWGTGEGQHSMYTVFLPLVEGPFRASLQGTERNELEICLESGDPAVQTSQGLHSVYMSTGSDVFKLITESVRAVESHLQTFQTREKKKMPGILDWFGWCTWDAFYTDVTSEGVTEGLQSLANGGTPPRFLIIDDGWQSVAVDHQPMEATIMAGTQYASRLTTIKENHKFQKDGVDGQHQEDPTLGLQFIVKDIKTNFKTKYVYVWHALTGYWGGVKPDVPGMEHYESILAYPVHSPGVLNNQPDMALDSLTLGGLGLVHPKKVFQFYDELHSYLASAGIDGVKVDVQNIIETLGAGFGGRVSLTTQYHKALEASIRVNFPDNGCISCMSQNTDGIYNSNQTAIVRASEDFWPRDPASHTVHIASVAYNSLFLGEFMQPDWDMFQSLHPAAEFHAAARAVGGCSVYVSDKPGQHNFELLKKLVLPDGSILRALLPGRPTVDCLFDDPARDGKSLLKIWNMNKHTGVLGVFNCQGAGWCNVSKKSIVHDATPRTLTGSVSSEDVALLDGIAEKHWNGSVAVYCHRSGQLLCLSKNSMLPVTLKVLEYEVFTLSPLKNLAPGVLFAPIGLTSMFNSGGAIESLNYDLHIDQSLLLSSMKALRVDHFPTATVKMRARGCGKFGVYSSIEPEYCAIDSVRVQCSYDPDCGLATMELPVGEEGQSWDVVVEI
ncbi:hypothetical protein O6H91_01G111600 [Diphasiastrum complanatum]|nr:hypothetical protein O6H91_01G111600 [Diphasiastrum complanatum]KAJ7570249.1 hypothetical protein O6H91_01G111600 [Diphasiastrum complanatum]